MRLSVLAARTARRLLPLVASVLFLTMVVGPAAVQATGASSSTGPSLVAQETTTSSTAPGQAVQPGQTAIVPPSATQVPLNPPWKTSQMEVRVMPEYDQKAVLVIMGFSLPANVPLPATLKFTIPAGAQIAGIGEVDPNGNFSYNYTTSYPPVEPGADWDTVTIEVKNYRQLQIDYYYDPGLPPGAGQRSFPLLAQMPMEVGTLVLHVQQPTGATNFTVQPALQASGKAGDGFTYAVATYPDVKAGSTLGHVVSYDKPDGGLSTDTSESGSTKVSTNTVLLAAILVIVVVAGALVVYRLFFSSAKSKQKKASPKTKRGPAATPPPAATKRQRQATKAPTKATPATKAPTKVATPKAAIPQAETPKADTTTGADTTSDAAAISDTAAERGDKVVEYCVACGEELTTESPFCPNCGEARS
jgi:hypothetical protein